MLSCAGALRVLGQLIWDFEPREGSNNTFNFLTNEKFKNYKILYIEK